MTCLSYDAIPDTRHKRPALLVFFPCLGYRPPCYSYLLPLHGPHSEKRLLVKVRERETGSRQKVTSPLIARPTTWTKVQKDGKDEHGAVSATFAMSCVTSYHMRLGCWSHFLGQERLSHRLTSGHKTQRGKREGRGSQSKLPEGQAIACSAGQAPRFCEHEKGGRRGWRTSFKRHTGPRDQPSGNKSLGNSG